jgi:DNA-binding MarR family transcriptional regulator
VAGDRSRAGHRTDGTDRPHQPLRRAAAAGGGRAARELTPGELARETFSSGAAVTKRLRALQERGLVDRRGDERDRRVAHVRLTDDGCDLFDRLLPERLAYESAVLSGVGGETRTRLGADLAELLGRLADRLAEARP